MTKTEELDNRSRLRPLKGILDESDGDGDDTKSSR